MPATVLFRLLHSQNVNCQYGAAGETYMTATRICAELEQGGHKVNKAVLHSEHCALLFAQSKYTEVGPRLWCWECNSVYQGG